jgi:exonuclease SbcD
VRAPFEELRSRAESYGDAWLRVFVRETPRAGLADEVRALLPRAVDVRVDAPATSDEQGSGAPARLGRAAAELFAEFLGDRGITDDRLAALFQQLLDEAVTEVPA